MLSLADIQNVQFTKVLGGYKHVEVDEFIDACAATVKALIEERDTLNKKMGILADKLLEYRNQEDSIRAALLSAQRLGDSTLREAQQKADLILQDAKIKAEKIIQEAEQKAASITAQAEQSIQNEKHTLEQLQREVADFKNRMLAIYKEHIALIQSLPEPETPEVETEQPAEGRSEELAAAGADVAEPEPAAQETVASAEEVETPAAESDDDMKIAAPETRPTPAWSEPAVPLTDMVERPPVAERRPVEEKEPVLAGQIAAKFQDLQFGEDYDLGLSSKKRRK